MKSIFLFLCVLAFCCSCSSIKKNDKNAYNSYQASQKSFLSKDGTLKYIDAGEGEKVILLLHGVPTSGWLYRKITPLLTKKGYRVIVPDMLGFGNSDNPKGYDLYKEEKHAERILALMDSLHINHWHHVMHDVGGLWTWELLKQAPKRITKISVLNTLVYPEGFHPPVKMKKGGFAKFSMWLYKNGVTTTPMLKMLFKKGVKDPKKITKSAFYGYKKPMLEGKTEGMYYFFTQTKKPLTDYTSVFKNLNIPVQFIWGQHDEMLQIQPQQNKILNDFTIQQSQIHLLDAKHFIQEEQPEQIVNFILDL